MQLAGMESWRISVRHGEQLTGCALWIRAMERIEAPDDPLVPGPLDADDLPPPSTVADDRLGTQWLAWWRSIVLRPEGALPPRPDTDPAPAPAEGTPDPLGLAAHGELAALVAARWREALAWHSRRKRRFDPYRPAPLVINEVVQEFERTSGRPARPFSAEFIVLPVRDDVIRRTTGQRYLVPERVYEDRRWRVWLTDLVRRIG